jgi:hypothetical protein
MMDWLGFVESGRGVILRYYPGIRLEGLRKITKNLSQASRSPGPRFEAGTSRIRSRGVERLMKERWCQILFLISCHGFSIIINSWPASRQESVTVASGMEKVEDLCFRRN